MTGGSWPQLESWDRAADSGHGLEWVKNHWMVGAVPLDEVGIGGVAGQSHPAPSFADQVLQCIANRTLERVDPHVPRHYEVE